MSGVCPRRSRLISRKNTFIADQRGAVALELPAVYIFLLMTLLLPLADVAIAGFQYISAWQALRAFGHSIQYSPPPDFANVSSWQQTAIAKADSKYNIGNLQVICGDANDVYAVCTAANAPNSPIKYYSYTATVTLAPLVLKQVLCTNGSDCTFTLTYSERFQ